MHKPEYMTRVHTYFILESAEFDMVLWCKRIVAAAYALKKQMKQNTIHFDQPSPYLLSALDFCNFPFWNIEFDEVDFFPSLNWIFLPAVACKIQVWNRLKIQCIKHDISNWSHIWKDWESPYEIMGKFQILWEGYKIWKKSPTLFWN